MSSGPFFESSLLPWQLDGIKELDLGIKKA